MVKAADMLIARRADTRARADFATWKMLAKLNGASALPAEAQGFLVSYKQLLEKMSDAEASEATIQLMYKSYYAEMGGSGTPPEIPSRASDPIIVHPERRDHDRQRLDQRGPDTGRSAGKDVAHFKRKVA